MLLVTQRRRPEHLDAYEVALRLTLGHEYYAPGDPHARFVIEPIRESLVDLQRRGILVRQDRESLVVLRNSARRQRAQLHARTEWVGFRVEGADEHFLSVSETEDGDTPTCLHLSNRRVSEPELSTLEITAARLPVLPALVVAPVKPGDTVDVIDMAGQPHLARTAAAQGEPERPAVGPRTAIAFDAARTRVQVDTRELPVGRYVVRVGGRVVLDGVRLKGRHHTVAVIELALAPTEATELGEFVFKARRTYWKYHVVSRAGSGPLDGLTIAAAASAVEGTAAPAFLGPFDGQLPNGLAAQHFLSAQPLPLVSRSPVRLRLSGRRQHRMTRDSVLVDCLPVPARHQLGLLTDDDLERLKTTDRLCSEMFVYV